MLDLLRRLTAIDPPTYAGLARCNGITVCDVASSPLASVDPCDGCVIAECESAAKCHGGGRYPFELPNLETDEDD